MQDYSHHSVGSCDPFMFFYMINAPFPLHTFALILSRVNNWKQFAASIVLICSLNKNQLGILMEYFVLRFQKNLNLVSVNLTMAATGFYQLSRKIQ